MTDKNPNRWGADDLPERDDYQKNDDLRAGEEVRTFLRLG
jgi:hypothetical protein